MSKPYQNFLYQAMEEDGIYYPDTDGVPMAENTTQYRWIVTIKEGLELELPNDFVGADLFWYPVKGEPNKRYAPDVMVALGRPKGERPSYMQWRENDVAPQIVFEILSPSNTASEMKKKLTFYEKYGVQEYYVYNPENNKLDIWQRDATANKLAVVNFVGGWTSPRLGIRFQLSSERLNIFHTNGEPFSTFQEVAQMLRQERTEKEQALLIVEKERAEKEKLKEKLRLLGIDPDSL